MQLPGVRSGFSNTGVGAGAVPFTQELQALSRDRANFTMSQCHPSDRHRCIQTPAQETPMELSKSMALSERNALEVTQAMDL